MSKEIELKLHPTNDDFSIIEGWLNVHAKFISEVYQKEFYLDNPKSSFKFEGIDGIIDAENYLRVRFSENGDSVCLKRFDIDKATGKAKNIGEDEYNVSAGDDALMLFRNLGFTKQDKVEKKRKTYLYNEFEIVIDEVQGLGRFVEIELIEKSLEEEVDIKLGFQHIYKFVKAEIGLSKIRYARRGYLSMIWNPNINFINEKNI